MVEIDLIPLVEQFLHQVQEARNVVAVRGQVVRVKQGILRMLRTESGPFLPEREYLCEDCGLVIDRDVNAAINILAEALFCELKIRFNTDVARRKFTPADLVALATSLSGRSETTEEIPRLYGTDAQCILTGDGRAALVDELFSRLRNHVANATVNCHV